MNVDNSQILKTFIPFLLLFLGFSFVISIYSTLGIYRPVNALMESVTITGGPSENHQNEFDYLRQTYENIISENDRNNATIQMVTPAVLKNMFTNLLTNKHPDPGYINETLNSLAYPFSLENKYFVMLIHVAHYGGAHLTEMESNLCQVHIGQVIEKVSPKACKFFLLADQNTHNVLILSFDAEISVIQAKQSISDLCDGLLEQIKSMPYQIVLGKGTLSTDLMNISSAYADALLMLRTEQYHNTDASIAGNQEIADDPQTEVDICFLMQRMKVIYKFVENGETEQANHLMEMTVDDFAGSATSGEMERVQYERLIDYIIESIISLKISELDWAYLNKKGVDKGLDDSVDGVQMRCYVKEYCARALELIDIYTRKRQNKYITAAKEYISENYTDSGLSLNTTSEHIGIHATYLSKLFNDALGQHFTSFLNEYRVEIAKQLLTATGQSVTDIGFKTGFNSAQSFIRVFKKHTGLTPGQYRGKVTLS